MATLASGRGAARLFHFRLAGQDAHPGRRRVAQGPKEKRGI